MRVYPMWQYRRRGVITNYGFGGMWLGMLLSSIFAFSPCLVLKLHVRYLESWLCVLEWHILTFYSIHLNWLPLGSKRVWVLEMSYVVEFVYQLCSDV